MNHQLVDRIAQAVLYEGYILYPYRPSVKNRQRWTFGGLCPRSYSEAQAGSDPWSLRTECLVTGDSTTVLTISVRCLQLVARIIGEGTNEEASWRPVDSLSIDGEVHQTWQEAIERTVDLGELRLDDLARQGVNHPFVFEARRESEPLRSKDGRVVGMVVRDRKRINGTIEAGARLVADGVYRLSVTVGNTTPFPETDARSGASSRDEALLHALVSTHGVFGVRHGAVLFDDRSSRAAPVPGFGLPERGRLAGPRRRTGGDGHDPLGPDHPL